MKNKTTAPSGRFAFGPKFKFLVLTLTLILFYTTLLFSATIYIDPSSNSSNPNGSMSNPYKSWTSVNFINGNTYLQKRGTTYTSSTTILISGRNNITIGAYGSGNEPKFAYNGSGHAFRLENSSSCVIENFEVAGNANAVSLIYVSGSSSNYSNNNTINNCNLHNAHNSNNGGFGLYGFYNNNLKMLNTEIHDVALDGVYLKFVTNLEIGHCNIYNLNRRYFNNTNQNSSSGDGIQLDGNYNGFHIHHTTIDRTNGAGNKYNLILNSAPGLSDNASGIIEYNTFINSDNIAYSVMIERGNGIITRYNTFKGSTGGLRLGGAYSKNNLIHHNIFYDCTDGIGIGYTYPSGGACSGTKVYNNVFYHVTRYHIWVDKTSVTTRNNIHYRANDNGVALYNYGGGSWTISHNCYGTDATAGTPGKGSSSVTGNPLFVNPAAHDFHLQSNSPCINKGTVVNLSHDIDGNSIYSGSAPDIGCYEHNNSSGSNHPPVINNQTFSVMSNATNGTTVGTVVASDPDAGQTLTYTITGGNTGNAFSIVSTSGVLKVNNASALTASSFALTVKVTDNGSPSMNASATITVNVTQANQAPVIANQTFSVMSNATNGTTVGTVVASDPDAGQTLTYTITGGNTGNAFSIVSTSGVLKVNNASALTASSFALTVKVTDNGSPSMNASATITVNVTQANQAPVIANQTFSVMSNATNGTTVGTVVASDPDAGQTLTYAITGGNTGNAFSIVSTSGVLKVNNAAALTASSFALTVKVTDNGSPSMNASATITVNVSQANQAPVIANQTFSVMSNATNSTTVGTVVASDPDAGQTLTYAITGGNTGNAFSIVSTTGVLKVNNASALTTSSFALTVKVTDNGSPSMNASATITVNVSQANQAPVIANQTFSVMSNATYGTVVGTVVASDPNAGQTLTYTITGGNTGNAFSIVSTSGVLKVNNASALTTSSFALTVKVTDNGSPSMNASATITVNVSQANQAPVIANQTFSVMSNATYGTVVGTVVASDPDAGQTLTYTITGGNTGNAFSIVSTSGVLKVNNASALTGSSFALMVKVTDNGSPSMNASATITVNVSQANQAPVIANQTFEVSQTASQGTVIGIIQASDPDPGQTLTFSISSGNSNGVFGLNSTSGALSVLIPEGLTPSPKYLNIKVTDNGNPSMFSEVVITINVLSTNNAPIMDVQTFVSTPYPPIGSTIGIVQASDPDPGQTLTFSIVAGNTFGIFGIDPTTGAILVNISYPLYPRSLYVKVRATDDGNPALYTEAWMHISIQNAYNPLVVNDQSFNVLAGSTQGTVVGTIEVFNPNPGQTFTFIFEVGNNFNIFNLNENTGEITVNLQGAIYPRTFYFIVRVTDNGTPSESVTALISIAVQPYPLNNNIPNQSFVANMDSPEGTILGNIEIKDLEIDGNSIFVIDEGLAESEGFAINPLNGKLSIANQSDLNTGVTTLNINVISKEQQTIIARTKANIMVKSAGILDAEQTSFAASDFKADIYPNPSTDGRFNLDLAGNANEEFMVQITDLNGRIIREPFQTRDNHLVINLSDQPKGTYLIVIKHHGIIKSIKALKS